MTKNDGRKTKTDQITRIRTEQKRLFIYFSSCVVFHYFSFFSFFLMSIPLNDFINCTLKWDLIISNGNRRGFRHHFANHYIVCCFSVDLTVCALMSKRFVQFDIRFSTHNLWAHVVYNFQKEKKTIFFAFEMKWKKNMKTDRNKEKTREENLIKIFTWQWKTINIWTKWRTSERPSEMNSVKRCENVETL